MIRLLLSVLLAATLLHACTKPVPIGEDFVEDDQIDVLEVDTFSLVTRTINPGPIIIYDSLPSLSSYLAGNLTDPIFGQSSSQIFGELRMVFPGGEFPENASLDSVVLGLAYDTLNAFGNYQSEKIDVSVYRLTEDMEFKQRYFSDASFMTESAPIGQLEDFVPLLRKNVQIYQEDRNGNIDTITLPPQLRLRIDDAIGEEFLSYDTTVLDNNEAFTEMFKGINLRVDSENSMIAFRLLSQNATMTMFYKEADTIPRSFTLAFTLETDNFSRGSALLPTFSHDHSNAPIEDFIDNEEMGDSLLFTQGMAGVEFEVEIPYIQNIDNNLVNYAELTFTVAELPEDNSMLFAPVDQLTAVYQDEEQDNRLVVDALLAEFENNRKEFIQEAFGGYVQEKDENGVTLHHYSMKLTTQVARMLDEEVPNKIIIRPRLKSRTASRVVVYGPGHSEYPMKFKTYLTTQ